MGGGEGLGGGLGEGGGACRWPVPNRMAAMQSVDEDSSALAKRPATLKAKGVHTKPAVDAGL